MDGNSPSQKWGYWPIHGSKPIKRWKQQTRTVYLCPILVCKVRLYGLTLVKYKHASWACENGSQIHPTPFQHAIGMQLHPWISVLMHVDAHIFSAIKTIDGKSENRVQKAKPPLPNQIPTSNTSHGNEVLLQDTMHLVQRPHYQWESLCQDPAGNLTTWRHDHCKEMQTAVVWICFQFIRSGQNYLARHSKRRKKTWQAEKEVGRQHIGVDRPWICQVPEGSGEQRKGGNWLWIYLWCPNCLHG